MTQTREGSNVSTCGGLQQFLIPISLEHGKKKSIDFDTIRPSHIHLKTYRGEYNTGYNNWIVNRRKQDISTEFLSYLYKNYKYMSFHKESASHISSHNQK